MWQLPLFEYWVGLGLDLEGSFQGFVFFVLVLRPRFCILGFRLEDREGFGF